MAVSPYPQNAAPDFTLAQLSGDPLTLSNFRGKPALINFWATWCPPCRRELPALQAAYTAYQDDIGFVAVNVKEDPAPVTALVQELGLNFPIALDSDGQVSNIAYEVRGLPTTVFVDANGVVVARHIGLKAI
jgi:thiol-disulfide isomerase/thioredoxin